MVEGFIENNGTDSTVFNLSRTIRLDTNFYSPELGAALTVEGTDNSSWELGEIGDGRYGAQLAGLINNNTSYRLHIRTRSGKQYASDYIPLVKDPPIDSISWRRRDDPPYAGIQIYANTHDPQNNTHYYRWTYGETWEFHSPFFATIKWDPVAQDLVLYHPNIISVCWHYDSSATVLLASSTQLAQDLIYEQPLVIVPLNSQQITVRYSILVKQYALTKDAFDWWQAMARNTELIGSIFGVQPSANKGNIRSLTDTSEIVLGFVSGGNTHSQRIFITRDQVAPWLYDPGCPSIPDTPYGLQAFIDRGYLPYDETSTFDLMSWPRCIDCTLTGTNIRPSFW